MSNIKYYTENPILQYFKQEELSPFDELVLEESIPREVVKLEAPIEYVEDAVDHIEERLRIIRPPSDDGRRPLEELWPLRYPAFDDLWLSSYDNNWKPESIAMDEDRAQWQAPKGSENYIDPSTRHMIMTNLAFFAPAEELIEDNVVSALGYYITMPEVKNYLARLGFEESTHARTFMWTARNLNIPSEEVYGAHEHVKCIRDKHEFMKDATTALINKDIDIKTKAGRRMFMEALLAQIIMEGVLFYGGFAMNLSLKDRGLMFNLNQQYEYIMRDESSHLLAMRLLFTHFKDVEWPDIFDAEFKQMVEDRFRESLSLETEYLKYALGDGVKGLRLEDLVDYTKYLINRRVEWFDLEPLYPEVTFNPFPELEKLIDLPKGQNFFEGHVSSYVDLDDTEGFG